MTRKDEIKRVVFCVTEKAKEQTEDMRLYIQIVMESRNSCIAGNWSRQIPCQSDVDLVSHFEKKKNCPKRNRGLHYSLWGQFDSP